MWDRLKTSPLFWPLAIILGAGLLAFAQTFNFQFIALDDSKHIWSNNYVTHFSWKNIQFFWHQPYYGLYIPFIYNTWALLAEITQTLGFTQPVSGLSSQLFHLFNLFIHLANGFLIFHILIFLLEKLNSQSDSSKIIFGASIGSIVFVLHPLQVEPVAWSSGLKDLFSTFFTLISFLLFFRQLEKPQSQKSKKQKNNKPLISSHSLIQSTKKRKLNFFLSLVFFIIALFCKPSVVVYPAALFVIVHFYFKTKNKVYSLIPYFAAIIPIIYLTKSLQPNLRLNFELDLFQYPLIALHSVGFYISKFLWPLGLAPDYGLSPPVAIASTGFYPLIILGAIFLGLAIFCFLKARPWSLGPILFFLGLFPVLGFVPFEYQNMSTVADRYLYFFPMMGLALLTAQAGLVITEKNRKILLGLVTLILLGFSFWQTTHWKNNATLFKRVLDVNPKSYLSYNNVGLVHLRAQRWDLAEENLKKALKIKPDYTAAQSNLGVVYFKRKDYPSVITYYSHVLKNHPNLTAGSSATFADMHYNLGAALVNTGKFSQSLIHLNKAAEINVNHFSAQYHRGRVYSHLKQYNKAKAALLQAYRINPKSKDVILELKKLRAQGVSF